MTTGKGPGSSCPPPSTRARTIPTPPPKKAEPPATDPPDRARGSNETEYLMINLLLAMWPVWVTLVASGIVALVEKNQQLDADIALVLAADLDFETHVEQAIEVTR